MKIIILSKLEFDRTLRSKNITNENIIDQENSYFISIIGTQTPDTIVSNQRNVLVLNFDDTTEDVKTSYMKEDEDGNMIEIETEELSERAMTIEQGWQIIEFLEKIDAEKTEFIIKRN